MEISYFEKRKYLAVLKTILTSLPYGVNRFYSKKVINDLKLFLNTHNDKYDVIWTHFMNMAKYFDYLTFKNMPITILDQHNADELYWHNFRKSQNLLYRIFASKNIYNLKKLENIILIILI